MGNRLKYWPGSLGSTPSLSDELMCTLSNFLFPHYYYYSFASRFFHGKIKISSKYQSATLLNWNSNIYSLSKASKHLQMEYIFLKLISVKKESFFKK